MEKEKVLTAIRNDLEFLKARLLRMLSIEDKGVSVGLMQLEYMTLRMASMMGWHLQGRRGVYPLDSLGAGSERIRMDPA